ncbi:Aste57867_14978 [Aphanomyces stellatus]|uniref:Aste57867_14978 protein n=1 Tax=Aphanomyces stellatus TaxID=120398 RepID=A0A485L224_9STRA|nr:hypothetical protein As57867_014922 [Aphanomyces stellatus]VFT91792.1 Aste57867_14978 [Aphanomyces stellatus]
MTAVTEATAAAAAATSKVVAPMVRRLLVGLGNPGEKYNMTRHNVGKMATMHFVAQHTPVAWTDVKSVHGEVLTAKVQFRGGDLIDQISDRRAKRTQVEGVPYPGVDLHGLLPSTYMNRSGMSVRTYMDAHRFRLKNNALVMNKHDELLVLMDDISIPFGTCKFKAKGGHGGQNGVRDIIKCVATEKFARLKIGIGCPSWFANPTNKGNPPPGLQLDKYVLGRFQPHEQDAMDGLLAYCAALLRVYMHRGLNDATLVANSGDMHTFLKKPVAARRAK